MRNIGLAAAAAIAVVACAGMATPAAADPTIVPSPGPLAFVDAFFGGAYFGGGGDGHNGFPWNTTESRPAPSVGCYLTEARVDNRWKRVQVCN